MTDGASDATDSPCTGADAAECKENAQRATCTCPGLSDDDKKSKNADKGDCPITPAHSTACICSSGASAATRSVSNIIVKNCFGKPISFIAATYVNASGMPTCSGKK